MSSQKNIVVAFDLYGTLLSTDSIAKQLAEHFGNEKATSIATVWRKYQLEYTWRLNSMGQFQSFSAITHNSLLHALAEHHLELSDSAATSLMKAYDSLSTYPDVDDALKLISQAPNITPVIFSNGTNEMVTSSVKHSPSLSPHAALFSTIITVDSVKRFEPAPEVYAHLAEQVGKVEKMSDMWLVSGNPFDIVGANAAGMKTAWIDRTGSGWCDRLSQGKPRVIGADLKVAVEAITDQSR